MDMRFVLRTEIAAAVETAMEKGEPVDEAAMTAHFTKYFEVLGVPADEIAAEVARAVTGRPWSGTGPGV